MREAVTKTIIILGMHRSGTSMVAGILKILGANMGEKLLGVDWSNPLGHFEDIDFVNLNDEILKETGGSWDNPPEKEGILTLKEKFSDRIKALVEKKRKSKVWGWKDPRTSLTIELYLPYLENPYFVVCRRNPKAVAQSLQRRDGMEIEEGIRLCEIYNQRINSFFEKYPDLKKLELRYEKVIENPEKSIRTIINFLGLAPSKNRYQEALNFILSPQEKEKLAKKIKREIMIKKINRGIKHPWKIPRFIWRKILFLTKSRK